ncbi:MAG: fibronectin type III domain-containing protein [Vicinamibacterales bacterium]
MRIRLRFALLLAACTLAATAAIHAAVTTVTFTFDAPGAWSDGIAQDGDGGSAGVPGITLQITMISDTAGTSMADPLNFDAGLFDYLTCYACNSNDGRSRGMKIASANGAEFQINGFNYSNWGESNPIGMTVKGYRNGAEVASTTFSTSVVGGWVSGTATLDSTFDNVDEVRLYSASNSWHGINGLQIDSAVVPPPATVTSVSSTTANGTYKVGDVLAIRPSFSDTVTVSGTPQLTLETGVTDRAVNYSSGSGTSTLTFNYTVQAGDTSADLDYVSTSALALNGGTITDSNGSNVTLTLPSPGAANSLGANKNFVIDGVAPTVSTVTSSTANGTYKIGDVISVQVNLSETVGVTGTPQLTLETGATDRVVNYASGSGTSTLTFSYTVQSGDTSADLDYTSTSALALNGGTIKDAAGNNATLTLATPGAANSLGANKNLVIDGVRPSVTSTAPVGGAVSTDVSVDFTVTFSESVANISTDDFALSTTGSASGTIASVSASSGSSVTVTVSSITGNGTIKLNLNASTNISDAAGNSGPAAYTSGTAHTVAIPTAPGAPTIGTATAGDAQASVTFTAPVNNGGSAITGYTVTSSPGGFTGTGASSPITVSGLTNGTAYTFTVTATNAVGTGGASAASNSVTPLAAQTTTFAQPSSYNFGTTPTLTASSSSGLTVSFTSSTTGVCTITSGGALTFVTAGTCTINADQAGNGGVAAAPQVTRSFTVNAVAPGAPTIGTATRGDTAATIAFTAPTSNGGSTITGYTVTSNPGGLTGTGAGSPVTVNGLTNGVSYTFTVAATNTAGTGASSAASNAVTPAAPQTITFANPGARNFGTSPTLSASSDSGLTVTFTSSTTGVCTVTSGGALTFVTAGTCTINADQAGNGSYLAATQVSRSFTVNAVVPGAPTIGIATAGDTQASVAFTAPASNGGSSITGYTVTVSPPDVAPVNGASSPIIVSGLTNGQAYTFTVTADNVAGTGPASAASNSVTPRATQTITFNNPGALNFGTTPTLSATSDSGLTPTFTSSTTGVCTITSLGALTFVTAGTCTINANQAGNGSYLPAAQVTRSFTVNAVVPGAPTIGTATAGDGQASVSFTAPASNGGASIASYTVTASPGGITATGAGSPIVVTGLSNGTSYTFTVRATNTAGQGAASAASNAVTPAFPTPTITVAIAPASVTEDVVTPIVVTVTRTPAFAGPTTVTLSYGGTATAGSDFLGIAPTVTIPSAATSTTFALTPLADVAPEGDETVTVSVVAGAGYTVGAPSTATATIVDDDGAGPTALHVTAMRGTDVTLAWTLPIGGPALTGVLLEGGPTPGSTAGIHVVLPVVPAATITLPSGTHYVRARTLTAGGPGVASNEVTVRAGALVAPSAPATPIATVDGTTVRLAWTPTFAGGVATGTILDVSGSASGSFPVAAGDTFASTTVAPGTYTIAIRHTNAAGSSVASTPVTVNVPGTCVGAPQTPTDVVLWSYDGAFYAQWMPPASGPAPTTYGLVVSGSWNGIIPLTGRGLAGPAPAGTYAVSVVAANACGVSAASVPQTIVVTSAGAGARPPVGVTDAYSVAFGATLSVPAGTGVLANDDARGGGALTASLAIAPAHGTATVAADGSISYTPTPGFAGTDTFMYQATTVIGGASSPVTVSIAVAGNNAPLAPSNVRITAVRGNDVTLAWTLPASGPAVLGVQLEAGDTPGAVRVVTQQPGALATYTGTLPTGTYYLRVRSITAAGASAASNEVMVQVGESTPPSAPLHLLGTVEGSAVQLAWTPTFAGGTAAGAVVDVTGAITASIPVGDVDAVRFPSVGAGVYTIRVRQVNGAGSSAASAPVTLTVPGTCGAAPQAPVDVIADVVGSTVRIAWAPPTTGTAPASYAVQVSGAVTATIPAAGRVLSVPAPAGSYTIAVVAMNACGASAPSASQTVTVP